jgi:hypothetical protein
MYLQNHFASGRPGTQALDDQQINKLAPSIFAHSPVAGVSERYAFLPTASILKGMRNRGWVPVTAAEQPVRVDRRRGFQKHILRFCRADQLGASFEARPEVVLINSHDKSSAYQLHVGFFRFVCSNGLVVANSTFERISIKHYDFNPESVIEASFEILRAVPDLTKKVRLFQDRQLIEHERLAFATGASALRWNDPNEAPIRPQILLNPKRYGDKNADLWTTFNVIQENLLRGGQRDYSRRTRADRQMPKSRAVKSIDEDMRLNKALWHMAEVLRTQTA